MRHMESAPRLRTLGASGGDMGTASADGIRPQEPGTLRLAAPENRFARTIAWLIVSCEDQQWVETIVFHRHDPARGTGQGRLSWYPNSRRRKGLIMGNEDQDSGQLFGDDDGTADPRQMLLPGLIEPDQPTIPGLFEP
jgi:hypothetical protein